MTARRIVCRVCKSMICNKYCSFIIFSSFLWASVSSFLYSSSSSPSSSPSSSFNQWTRQTATKTSVLRFGRRHHHHGKETATHWHTKATTTSRLEAHSLTSALESLARERNVLDENDWLSLSCERPPFEAPGNNNDTVLGNHVVEKEEPILKVPLYPLPAVYIPTGGLQDDEKVATITYTLQNVEPRNVQMALDLARQPHDDDSSSSRFFCATLRTIDTGRLAKVGTLMEILDMQVQYNNQPPFKAIIDANNNNPQNDEKQTSFPSKIVLTCVAQDIVDIQSIENPQAADWEYRLRRPREYVKAKIRRRHVLTDDDNKNDDDDNDNNDNTRCEKLAAQIQQDFNRVGELLMEGYGVDALPPFARTNLAKDLPCMDTWSELLSTKVGFWKFAYRWQTYAYTLREGFQQTLASDRNELLIAGALKQGGPLNLPVHLEDLYPADRQAVLQLESRMQQEWLETGVDPVLDLQALLQTQPLTTRLERLAQMVARERDRLTAIALLPKTEQNTASPPENVVRKGAWFDDEYW